MPKRIARRPKTPRPALPPEAEAAVDAFRLAEDALRDALDRGATAEALPLAVELGRAAERLASHGVQAVVLWPTP